MSDTWPIAKATVTDCNQSLLRSSYGGDGTIARPEYKAYFEYRVNGTCYQGSMIVGTKWKSGRTFEISYDPNHPRRNTASRSFDPSDRRSYLYYLIVWGGGAVLLYLIIRYLPSKSEMLRP
jgi:hypothetical protein